MLSYNDGAVVKHNGEVIEKHPSLIDAQSSMTNHRERVRQAGKDGEDVGPAMLAYKADTRTVKYGWDIKVSDRSDPPTVLSLAPARYWNGKDMPGHIELDIQEDDTSAHVTMTHDEAENVYAELGRLLGKA